MEIVSIALTGSLAHRDSMGHIETIGPGEVQAMSAGSGITHSEYNASETEAANFLQIWVIPDARDVEPVYDQRRFEDADNGFTLLVSPDGRRESLSIGQDAFFSRGRFSREAKGTYEVHSPGNGVFIFQIEGALKVGGNSLQSRDALGVWETDDRLS